MTAPVLIRWRGLLLLQAFRPDRLLAKMHLFIETVFMHGFMLENPRKLTDAVDKEIDAMTPVLLCGVSGYDPSTNVRDLVALNKTQCTEIALGAGEVLPLSFHLHSFLFSFLCFLSFPFCRIVMWLILFRQYVECPP